MIQAIPETAVLAAVLAVTLGVVEALKVAVRALVRRNNKHNNPGPTCQYDRALGAEMNAHLEEIIRRLGTIEERVARK